MSDGVATAFVQELFEQLRQANRECKHTHKDTDGNWVQHEKPKNPITRTIERYAKERHMTQRA